jgi:DNA-binding NarL/FixJ family response regulator
VHHPPGLTRVVIVEDHLLLAEDLELTLALGGHDVRRLPVADRAVSTGQVLAATLRFHPRIVLLELDLGSTGNGAHLVASLTQARIAVIVVTGSIDRARWGECIRFGARTVVPDSAPLDTIVTSIRLVCDGRPALDRRLRDSWVARYHREKFRAQGIRTRLEALTAREREVMANLVAGHPLAEVAGSTMVSEATLRIQVKSIMAKLDVPSPAAAVRAAHHAQWQPPALREGA